ncbi:MAG: DNA repair protein RadC [Pseudomonadales bacterium]|nr:DNA repair protein RadC [Pseudomonadales bacterium]
MNTTEEQIVTDALSILKSKMHNGPVITEPQDVKDYIRLNLATSEREVFAVMFLDQGHKMIEFDILFKGTIAGAAIYPREIIKAALLKNAAAIIIAHNHPSGRAEPSLENSRITDKIKESCDILEIRYD